MPLDPVGLIADLTDLFTVFPPNAASSAQKMALAYGKYAAQAIAVGAVPCPLVAPGNPTAMVPLLLSAMTPAPVPGKLETAWVQAIQLYWAAAQFVGPPLPPSVAPTVAPGAGIVFAGAAAILGTLSVPSPSAGLAAARFGTALHVCTVSGIAQSNAGPLKLT